MSQPTNQNKISFVNEDGEIEGGFRVPHSSMSVRERTQQDQTLKQQHFQDQQKRIQAQQEALQQQQAAADNKYKNLYRDLKKFVPQLHVLEFGGNETHQLAANSLQLLEDPSYKHVWDIPNQYDRQQFAAELAYSTPGIPNQALNERYRAVQQVVISRHLKNELYGDEIEDLQDYGKALDAIASGRPVDAMNLIAGATLDEYGRKARFFLAIAGAMNLDPFSARMNRCINSVISHPFSFRKNIKDVGNMVNGIGNDILAGTVSGVFHDIKIKKSFGVGFG